MILNIIEHVQHKQLAAAVSQCGPDWKIKIRLLLNQK